MTLESAATWLILLAGFFILVVAADVICRAIIGAIFGRYDD